MTGRTSQTDPEMPEDIAARFIELTKHRYLGPSAQLLGYPPPPTEWECPPDETPHRLPEPDLIGAEFKRLVDQRRSVRNYAPKPLRQEELSYLLWCTQGIRQTGGDYTLRTVPSAGARHALETIVLVNRVEGLAAGLYRYHAREHALVVYDLAAALADKITHACLDQGMIRRCGACFIWVAEVYRMTWRYGPRGYRYLFLDAGHVCQNLYLAAEAIGCGVCAVAAYDDDAMNRLLKLDGRERFVIYLATVGHKLTEKG